MSLCVYLCVCVRGFTSGGIASLRLSDRFTRVSQCAAARRRFYRRCRPRARRVRPRRHPPTARVSCAPRLCRNWHTVSHATCLSLAVPLTYSVAAAYGRAIESGRYHAAKDICAGACRYTLFVTRLCDVSLCLFRDLWASLFMFHHVCVVPQRSSGAAAAPSRASSRAAPASALKSFSRRRCVLSVFCLRHVLLSLRWRVPLCLTRQGKSVCLFRDLWCQSDVFARCFSLVPYVCVSDSSCHANCRLSVHRRCVSGDRPRRFRRRARR